MAEYIPVTWVDHVSGQVQGTLVNKARLDQMQTQYRLTKSARSLTAAPSAPVEGDWYYDTSKSKLRIFSGGVWEDIADMSKNLIISSIADFLDVAKFPPGKTINFQTSNNQIINPSAGSSNGYPFPNDTGAWTIYGKCTKDVANSQAYIEFYLSNSSNVPKKTSLTLRGTTFGQYAYYEQTILTETFAGVIAKLLPGAPSYTFRCTNADAGTPFAESLSTSIVIITIYSASDRGYAVAEQCDSSTIRRAERNRLTIAGGWNDWRRMDKYHYAPPNLMTEILNEQPVSNLYFRQTIAQLTALNGTTPFKGISSNLTAECTVYKRSDTDIRMDCEFIFSGGDYVQKNTITYNGTSWSQWLNSYPFIPIYDSNDLLHVGTNTLYKGYYWGRGEVYRMMNDIDMTGVSFTPLCPSSETSFIGTFDGNGHKISNLTYSVDVPYAGLFGYVSIGAVIRNLKLENINATNTSTTSSGHIGGIAGFVAGTGGDVLIDNCNVSGEISNKGLGAVAGIIGYKNMIGTLTIKNCTNRANLTSLITSGTSDCAGIAYVASTSNIITMCKNYGNLIVTVSGASRVGGIVSSGASRVVGTITKCINYGNITVNNSSTIANYVGGIGSYAPQIPASDCVNYGNISLTSVGAGSFPSGIFSVITTGSTITINRCANYGSISSHVGTGAGGGILGYFSGAVTFVDCYNFGRIYSEVGGSFGGIAGNASALYSQTFVNCYNLGKVKSGTASTNIGSIMGGVNGAQSRVINCYYLTGCLSNSSGLIADNFGAGIVLVDGTSTPARASNQSSGAKQLNEMQALISDLQDGTSIYYTGSTVANGVTYAGYDFDNVWKGTHCLGSPELRESQAVVSGMQVVMMSNERTLGQTTDGTEFDMAMDSMEMDMNGYDVMIHEEEE